jgi:hypothetical protein
MISDMADAPRSIVKWTFLLFQLNALLDKGEHLDPDETSRRIMDGTVFDWLRSELPFPKLDLSVYDAKSPYPVHEMIDVLQRIDGVGRSEFAVGKNGLAMLVAYGLQAIQQGE